MTKDEALRLALEALGNSWTEPNNEQYKIEKEAITAIKAALEANDEPVPVAIVEVFGKDWRLDYMALPVGKHKLYAQQYTYTTPPQRTWVGLTDEEIAEVEDEYIVDYRIPAGSAWNFAKHIEAKLKEKNT